MKKAANRLSLPGIKLGCLPKARSVSETTALGSIAGTGLLLGCFDKRDSARLAK
jgi:hypothetical protein